MTQPLTKTGRLSEIARHVVLPSGITATGWPSVRDRCAGFGVRFDEWQDGAGRAALAKRKDGKFAATVGGVVMSIPRQVGKTFLMAAIIFALCMLTPNLTVLWTAHRLRTANETFAKLQSFAKRKRVKPYVSKIYVGSGEGEIIFHNGSRILFGARERGFGRGFDDVDVEVFDEAQILSDNALDDMVPATNTAANPLLFFIGTPPKPSDRSEVFTRKRGDALAGDSDDTVYIEMSADQDCNPRDRKQWAKANPSYPKRTPVSAMLRMQKNLKPDSFAREALGIWEDETTDGPISSDGWKALEDLGSLPGDTVRLAFDMSPDLRFASFSIAGHRVDGFDHVEVRDRRPGDDWVMVRGKQLFEGHKTPVVIVSGSPGMAFKDTFTEAGVTVDVMSPAEFAASWSRFLLATTGLTPTVRHHGQPTLRVAVAAARTKTTSEGLEVLTRKNATTDISPLTSTVAAFGRLVVPTETLADLSVVYG